MSQENVEAWRASIEDMLSCTGEDEIEAWITRAAALWHPDIEWDLSAGGVLDLGGVYRGRDAVIGFWRAWLAAWETVVFDYELVDAGDRVVVLIDQQRMRGRSSGIEVALGTYAQVATFRDGLMVHWRPYASHSEALEAVGLPE
jgi:hypothetical protein